jgi:uncharacterized membrane protein YeiH
VIAQLQTYLQGDPLRMSEAFAVAAIVFFSLTGALAGMRRRYDVIGVFVLALVVGAGGGLIRDGIFLQQGPPMLIRDWHFLPAVLGACLIGWIINNWVVRFEKFIAILDAVGLSIFTMAGLIKSIEVGLSVPGAILVAIVNAAGGGLLRDVLTREEPLLFKPGQFYVLASFAGCIVFLFIAYKSLLPARRAAEVAMGTIFILRILAIKFNWRTSPMQPWFSVSTSPTTTTTSVKPSPPTEPPSADSKKPS